jgi:two-component system chemotaxis response regulator CheY
MASILIIDDSPSIRVFLEQALVAAGHEVTSAHDGRQGLATLRSRSFDLVITDIFMPETDGIETIRNARKAGILPRVIAISSKDSIMNLLPAAKMLGAMHTIQKPFTAEQLLAAVSAVLQQPPPAQAATGP